MITFDAASREVMLSLAERIFAEHAPLVQGGRGHSVRSDDELNNIYREVAHESLTAAQEFYLAAQEHWEWDAEQGVYKVKDTTEGKQDASTG